MTPIDIRHRLLLGLVVLAVAFIAFMPMVEGASTPHTHRGSGAAIYNADCALALLERLTGSAPVPDALPTVCWVTVATHVVVVATVAPDSAPPRHAAPRAPPR